MHLRVAPATTPFHGCVTFKALRVRKEVLILLSFVALLALACHKTAPPPNINVQYEVLPQPPRLGITTINLRLTQKDGQPVKGARVELEGNMSHAGMSPVTSDAKEIEAGKYSGTVQLEMAGDWIVVVHITLADGQEVQRQIEIKALNTESTK